MPCAAFEDLLRDYDELTGGARRSADAHLAVCRDCRAYRETLVELDRELVALYSGLQPRRAFAAQALSRANPYRRPKPPSFWPEVLDFCGWAAIVAIVALLAATVAARAGIAL
jgi:hypothetical protein